MYSCIYKAIYWPISENSENEFENFQLDSNKQFPSIVHLHPSHKFLMICGPNQSEAFNNLYIFICMLPENVIFSLFI